MIAFVENPALGPVEPPQSFEEMCARAKFAAPLDPKAHKLTEVLSLYSFKKKSPCGLSSCRTGHNYGFLVRTASGVETNIGNVCGKKYFGEDFVIAAGAHRREVARREALSQLAAVRMQRGAIEARVAEVISDPFGVKWKRRLHEALQRRIGGEAVSMLSRKTRSGDYRVEAVTERTEEEIQRAIFASRRSREDERYRREVIGVLAPMRWLVFDFKGKLIDGLQVPLRAVCEVSEGATDTRILQKLLKPLQGWEAALEESRSVLSEAKETLAPRNLALLGKAVISHRNGKLTSGLEGWERTDEYKALAQGQAAA